ncbi:hypothetical protein FJTKL_03911 [Diaporthe vaccinii]|uniref:Uncharacterized protein n=1 Tax=Diaporthe vaccinii TaxID=105482 RepID=A0ABR4F1H5_9PEZI
MGRLSQAREQIHSPFPLFFLKPYLDCYTLINLFPFLLKHLLTVPRFQFSFTTLATVHIFLGEERSILHLQSLVRNWIWSDRPPRQVKKNPRQFLWNSATQTITGILSDIPSFGKSSTLVGPRDKSHLLPPITPSTAPAWPRARDWQRRPGTSTKTTTPPLPLPNGVHSSTSSRD